MNIDKLVPFAVSVSLMAAATGNLPWFIKTIRKAQIQLIQESKASKWGKPWMLK